MKKNAWFRSIAVLLLLALMVANVLPAVAQSAEQAQTEPVFPWVIQFGTKKDDNASAIAVSPSGRIIVAGTTEGLLGAESFGEDDIWVAAFDTLGGLLWLRQFGGPDDEAVNALAVSDAGEIFVAGRTYGLMFSDVPAEKGGYLLALDENGDELWHAYEPVNFFQSVALHESAIYVAGGGYIITDPRADVNESPGMVAAFDRNGTQRWRADIPNFTASAGSAIGLVGDTVVVGGSAIDYTEGKLVTHLWSAAFDLAGDVLHFDDIPMSRPGYLAIPQSVVAGADGHPLMVGTALSATPGDVMSFGWQAQKSVWPDGYVQWDVSELRTGGHTERVSGLTSLGDDGYWLSGYQVQYKDAYFTYVDDAPIWLAGLREHKLRWLVSFGEAAFNWVTAPVHALDGAVYLAGSTSGELGGVNHGQTDVWLMRIELDALGMPQLPRSLRQTEQEPAAPQPQRSEYADLQGKIVFIASPNDEGNSADPWLQPHQLHVINPDGSGLARITEEEFVPWKPATVSPNGTLIALSSFDQAPVRIIDLGGKVVGEAEHPGKRAHAVDWSEKNGLILFVIVERLGEAESDQDLWTLSYPGMQWTQITSDDEVMDWDASWSPDGTQIAVDSDSQLWIMNADGSEPRRIGEQAIRFVDWSSDGRRLAYQSQSVPEKREDWDLWVVDVDGSNPQNVTRDPELYEESPEWSPDGRYIVYDARTNIDGSSALYVLNVETGEKRLLRGGESNNVEAIWVPGSPGEASEDASLSVTDKLALQTIGFIYEGGIWAIQADGSNSQRLTDPTQVGNALAFAWSPDGSRIAMIAQQPGSSPRILSLDIASGEISELLSGVDGVKLAWSGDKLVILIRELTPDDPNLNAWENKLLILDLSQLPIETTTIEGDWIMPATEIGDESYVTVSADGQWILFVDSQMQGLVRMDGAIIEPPDRPSYMMHPQWIGNTNQVSYSVGDGSGLSPRSQVYRFDPDTGFSRLLMERPAGFVRVSGDNQYAAVTDPALKRLDLDTNRLFTLSEDRAAYPLWSPDGNAILYQWTTYNPEIIGGAKMAPDWESDLGRKIVTSDGQYQKLLLPNDATDLAWRPQAGGEWVELQPQLLYDGHEYNLGYRTSTPHLIANPWALFADYLAEPQSLVEHNITGVRLARDGRLITDLDEAERVLRRYLAAYLLYQKENAGPDFEDLDTIDSELKSITENPLIILGYGLGDKLANEDSLWRQTLRAMLTQQSRPVDLDSSGEWVIQNAIGQESIGAALGEAARNLDDAAMRERVMRMGLYFQDWKVSQNGIYLRDKFYPLSNSQVLRLTLLLYQLAAYHGPLEDNAQLLEEYAKTYPEGEHAFSIDQKMAVEGLVSEVDVDWQRVSDLVEEYLLEVGSDFEVFAFSEWAVHKLNKTAVTAFMYGHAARILSAGAIGFSVGGYVMGLDQLYDHFSTAERANELRKLFQGASEAAILQAEDDQGYYDGDLAERYLVALRLEVLSAVQTRSSYIDGVSATVEQGVASPIYLSNLISGVDWEGEARRLQADTYERFAQFQLTAAERPSLKLLARMAVVYTNFDHLVVPTVPVDENDLWGAVVLKGPLNVRAEPSTQAIVVDQLDEGTNLTLLGRTPDGQWLNIRSESGAEGWVSAQYVEIHN